MKVKSFIANFIRVMKQARTAQKEILSGYVYKIAGKEKCEKTGEEKLLIQIIGKHAFVPFTPIELAESESMLKNFSPADVNTIIELARQADKSRTIA